jgi:hypothetical protein
VGFHLPLIPHRSAHFGRSAVQGIAADCFWSGLPPGEKEWGEVYVWIPVWLQERVHERARLYGEYIFGEPKSKNVKDVTETWREKLNRVWKLCGPFAHKPHPHRFRHTFARLLLEVMEPKEIPNLAPFALESAQAESEIEDRLKDEIRSLWSVHRVGKARAQPTKEQLKTLRLDLGGKLCELKATLVRTGRAGGWAAYLRSQDLPRASGERYIRQHELLLNPKQIDSPKPFLNHLRMTFEDWCSTLCRDSAEF